MSKQHKIITAQHIKLIVIVMLIPIVAILLTGLCFYLMDNLFENIPTGVYGTVAVFCTFIAGFAALLATTPEP